MREGSATSGCLVTRRALRTEHRTARSEVGAGEVDRRDRRPSHKAGGVPHERPDLGR